MMTLGRVCLLIMDSFGIGASADATRYHDVGANTFLHIAEACAAGLADREGLRSGPLRLPNLARLGLYHATNASVAADVFDVSSWRQPEGRYGYAVEQSLGKDTPSGHWEMAGVPVVFPWGYFPDKPNCFPESLIHALIQQGGLPGVLGECHASGTTIIETLGEEHVRTGKPIVYTSADSVLQIAAHEETFGLQRLYDLCEYARQCVDEYAIGRVIARPFKGTVGHFERTGNRRDYATPPPEKTLLDFLNEAGREVIGIGKISDIFAHQGITRSLLPYGNSALFDATLAAMHDAAPGSLIFTNFVDFDSMYGHRRDVIGYAHALEVFDARLPELMAILGPQDRLILSADHGCDPTFPGSDHTREHVPVLAYGPSLTAGEIGRCDTFADIGQSIAKHLHIAPLSCGVSFF